MYSGVNKEAKGHGSPGVVFSFQLCDSKPGLARTLEWEGCEAAGKWGKASRHSSQSSLHCCLVHCMSMGYQYLGETGRTEKPYSPVWFVRAMLLGGAAQWLKQLLEKCDFPGELFCWGVYKMRSKGANILWKVIRVIWGTLCVKSLCSLSVL